MKATRIALIGPAAVIAFDALSGSAHAAEQPIQVPPPRTSITSSPSPSDGSLGARPVEHVRALLDGEDVPLGDFDVADGRLLELRSQDRIGETVGRVEEQTVGFAFEKNGILGPGTVITVKLASASRQRGAGVKQHALIGEIRSDRAKLVVVTREGGETTLVDKAGQFAGVNNVGLALTEQGAHLLIGTYEKEGDLLRVPLSKEDFSREGGLTPFLAVTGTLSVKVTKVDWKSIGTVNRELLRPSTVTDGAIIPP